MSYRGRLIRPMLVRIARLDVAATALDPDGTGPQTAGYDEDFREPVRIADGTQAGASARVEMAPIELLAQIEDTDWESLGMTPTGNDPSTSVSLVFHFADLEAAELVDPITGRALCPVVGDRLVAILDPRTGAMEQSATDRGLYCVHAQPRSYGLSGSRRNLMLATFVERGLGPR